MTARKRGKVEIPELQNFCLANFFGSVRLSQCRTVILIVFCLLIVDCCCLLGHKVSGAGMGNKIAGLTFYPSNDHDPYITLKNVVRQFVTGF